jgi:SAM-dependent methyltransferase
VTDATYFDRLYAASRDPWALASSDYERRKLSVLLACLPRARYGSAFEPGSAIGVTTAALAERCDRLLAMDCATAAVDEARRRVTASGVTITQGCIPVDWPSRRFDLLVLSELLYYLDDADRARVVDLVTASLCPGGDLIAVHWRAPFEEATTTGGLAHGELEERLTARGLQVRVRHEEPEFLLLVLHRPVSAD